VLTPPVDLNPDDLRDAVERAWGVDVDSLEYLPIGFGSHHWVATDNLGGRHFVTVDALSPDSRDGDEVSIRGLHLRRAMTAAADLRACGCEFVVAPTATMDGDPFSLFGTYVVALFPFIEGRIIEGRSFAIEDSFARADLTQVIEIVAALHKVPITSIRTPAADDFVVPWLDQLDQLDLFMNVQAGASGPYGATATQLLVDNEGEIRRLTDRYRSLLAQYLSNPGPVVVTHGEIHPGNVIATTNGWMIVDWDTVLIGPPERDLWNLASANGSDFRDYAHATGVTPNLLLIELYAIRWDLSEIASFAEEFRLPHEDTEDTRRALDLLGSVVGGLRNQESQAGSILRVQ
jgi:spectinomycin phosphotransferase/16S rRNA (guanine(1405)-N(7))-methyltransferase